MKSLLTLAFLVLTTITAAAQTQPLINEFSKFEIPRITNRSDQSKVRDVLNTLGSQGWGQCTVFIGTKYLNCLRPESTTDIYEWRDWPWVNGQLQRDELFTKVSKLGYSNIFIYYGTLWASKKKY